MILSDLNIHSTFSDGKFSIPQIVDLYGSLGFGAIGITDLLSETKSISGKAAICLEKTLTASTFPLYREILKSESERAWDQYKMLLLPGIEFKKKSIFERGAMRLIGLGISEYFTANNEVLELTKAIHGDGGVTIAAQPLVFRELWKNRDEFQGEIDAWEITNGSMALDEVILQTNLPKIAGSSLRNQQQLSSWKTVLHCERNQDAMLDAIRKQNLSFRYFNEGIYDRTRHFSNVYPVDFRNFSGGLRHHSFTEAL